MGYLLDKGDQAALSNQQDVVRNERRQSIENQPYGLAEEALVQEIFPKGHPAYGNVIGSHEDIQAARLEDVKGFFRQYYAPKNAGLVISGDFDPAATRKLVEKYFATLKRGPTVPAIKADTPKISAERRKVVTSRVELPRVYMAWLTSPTCPICRPKSCLRSEVFPTPECPQKTTVLSWSLPRISSIPYPLLALSS
jgi:zinc protease